MNKWLLVLLLSMGTVMVNSPLLADSEEETEEVESEEEVEEQIEETEEKL